MKTNHQFPFKLIPPKKWYQRCPVQTTEAIELTIALNSRFISNGLKKRRDSSSKTPTTQDKTFTIEKGFIFDGASIPRVLRGLFSPYGSWLHAACIHDWFYKMHVISKWQADAHFRKQMIQIGFHQWIAWFAWGSLQLFGWVYWIRRNKVIDI